MPPYISGEVPTLGDLVSDSSSRSGIVTRFLLFGDDLELIVEWEDGTTGIRHFPTDVVLISRANQKRTIPQ